ncbi:MAG: phage major capsid protein [Pseudomonadota bacterium]
MTHLANSTALARGILSIQANAAPHLMRGIVGPGVLANGRGPGSGEPAPAQILAALNDAFEDFKERNGEKVDDLTKALDQAVTDIAALKLGGPGTGGDDRGPKLDPEYTASFEDYARSGAGVGDLLAKNREGTLGRINASMTVSPGEAGGFLAPIEWDRRISKVLTDRSPMRQVANVISTSVRGYSTLWNDGAWGSGWVGETAARPQTATPTLSSLTFEAGELYAFPMVSQQLVDDADFDLESWLASEVSETFDIQEGVAFISGNGTNKPRGILTYAAGGVSENHHPGGALSTFETAAAAAIAPDELVDFVYTLPAPYRQGARWMMNSTTAAVIAKMKDGDGNYLWRETYVSGQPATLLGYPVTIDENMPSIAANALPILFGNFERGYVINDRIGVRVLRDPFTNKPFVGFYTTKRVGGGIDDIKALQALKMAAA